MRGWNSILQVAVERLKTVLKTNSSRTANYSSLYIGRSVVHVLAYNMTPLVGGFLYSPQLRKSRQRGSSRYGGRAGLQTVANSIQPHSLHIFNTIPVSGELENMPLAGYLLPGARIGTGVEISRGRPGEASAKMMLLPTSLQGLTVLTFCFGTQFHAAGKLLVVSETVTWEFVRAVTNMSMPTMP